MKVVTHEDLSGAAPATARWNAYDDETYDGMAGSPLGTGATPEAAIADLMMQLEPDEPGSDCAHEWSYTGTAYGGDDPSYFGEGRCFCIHCGADGDG